MTLAKPSSAESTAPPVAVHKLLSGQKALVTGANSGIGKGVAIALGEAGADVVVNYVDGDDAANAVVERDHRNPAPGPMRTRPTCRRKTRSRRCSRA